jgi:hypothetical protein
MTRRELSVQIEESLLDAVRRAAVDDDVEADAVVEQALRRYFGLRGLMVLDDTVVANPGGDRRLSEDEAIELAVREVRAYRAERAGARSNGG